MTAPRIPVSEMRRAAWGHSYERGAEYARDGSVVSVDWDAGASALAGRVRGSGRAVYRTRIVLRLTGGAAAVASTDCSCPVGEGCKHAVATMIASNRNAVAPVAVPSPAAAPVAGRSAPPPAQPPVPASMARAVPTSAATRAPTDPVATPLWRQLISSSAEAAATPLALGLELRRPAATNRSRWGAPTTTTVHAGTAGAGGLQLAARPLMRSPATGAWIKGRADWEGLRWPGRDFDADQARWFVELRGMVYDPLRPTNYAGSAEWLPLDTIDAPLLAAHLPRAAALGIPIVAAQRDLDVTVADAEVHLTLGPQEPASPDSGLRLAVAARLGGEEVSPGDLRPLGLAGVYRVEAVDRRLRVTLGLCPLDAPARQLLTAGAPADVPPAEVEAFLAEAYPTLRRVSRIEPAAGFALPAIAPPTLVVRVAHRAGGLIDVVANWRYAGGREHPFAANDDPARDAGAEAPVRERCAQAWTDAGGPPFTAQTTFTGVEAAEFSVRTLPAISVLPQVEVVTSGTPRVYEELSGEPHIRVTSVEAPGDNDWFDLGVVVTIDGRRIPFAPLFTALTQGRKKLLLADGAYFSLAHPALQRLRELIDEAGTLEEWETGPRISRYQTAFWEDFEDLADEAEPAVTWRETVQALRTATAVPEVPVPGAFVGTLRPYQREGLSWLSFLWQHGLGGILADDMGLGKTLQLLALVGHARESGETRPFLVVAPTSVLSTWQQEAARFVPSLPVAVIDATASRRTTPLADEIAGAALVVTSYAIARLDEDEFSRGAWAALVLDEAQFVKNAQTKLYRAIRGIPAPVTIAVTGTPVENSLADLWALLALTCPGLFPSARRFRSEYLSPIEHGKVAELAEGAEERAARLARLRRRIRPFLLRRTKELVAQELPPKQEQVLRVELAPAHRALYDRVLQRERQKVLGLLEDLDRNRFIVFRSLTLLRLLSLAPQLIDEKHAAIPSAKLDALLDRVAEIAAEGHRVLAFSQFTSFLQLAAARLDAAGIAHDYLDGATRRRAVVISRWREGDAPALLISLKAGGFGLTLTDADYVFLLDPWWNPAAERQAIDRTHRIGQQKQVFVYRLIAENTIEEKVLALQQRKARLFQAVMDDDDMFASALSADDIRSLFEG